MPSQAVFGDNNKVNGNSIFNSDESGVFVQGNQNDVNGNTINETPVGILESAPSSGNKFGGGNKFFNTGVDVVQADSSAVPSFSTSSTARVVAAQP
jgi:nitrous oxidase accessory protein NosD